MESKLNECNLFGDRLVKWLYYDHGINHLSRTGLETFARRLEAKIGQESTSYDEIILVGHSLGALVARKAWLNAVDSKQGNDYTNAGWGKKVTRFVLFAGISRGLDTEKSWSKKILTRLVEALPGRFTIEDCYRGSAFITNLRISWIQYIASLPLTSQPITVQVLGTEDGLVKREDSIDLDVFPETQPIAIAGAGHGDVHTLAGSDAEGRLQRFVEAFTRTRSGDASSLEAAYLERRVLLIVHGIRASPTDNWVKRAKRLSEEGWPDVIAVSPNYLYLSAFRFALPAVRKRYARFFRDFYTEQIARVRRSKISVLGHSNGSYLLGGCLKEFQAISVDKVCVAGSVLPANYDWTRLVNSKRVTGVRNDCAANDYPVAILCKALRALGMTDVGTGGFDGFVGNVKDVRFHKGGHDSMLGDDNLLSMLRFLLDNNQSDPKVDLLEDAAKTRRWSRATPYIVYCIIIGIVALMVLGASLFGSPFIIGSVVILVLVATALDIF
jgi:pimeloyl-ACP methyl ester carboxylesterase